MEKAMVTSFNLRFLAGGEALLKSFAKFHPDIPRYSFVPADEATNIKNRVGYLTSVIPLPRAIRGVPDHYQVGVGRVFISSINADCAVYFDSDIVLCAPVPEYFSIQTGMVNAVTDVFNKIIDNVPPPSKLNFQQQFPDICQHKGFNAGVFALHPKEWTDLPERFEQILEDGHYPVFPYDQVILNAIFFGRVNFLPFSFNAHVLSEKRIPKDVRVIHFTCPEKPWMPNFPKHEPVYYYWLCYGVQEKSFIKLQIARLIIFIMTPRRIIMPYVRKFFKNYIGKK